VGVEEAHGFSGGGPSVCGLWLVLWCFIFVVTESSTGPLKQFKETNVAHVGGHGRCCCTGSGRRGMVARFIGNFGLWSVYFTVTLASTGPLKLFSPQHTGAVYRSLVVEMIDSD
jgi:hypothetical protein